MEKENIVSNNSEYSDNESKELMEIKSNYFENYDDIADLNYYSKFISHQPIPADYLSCDYLSFYTIKEERDSQEALRYGIDPAIMDYEELNMENDDRYINLNMDIDFEPDEYITDKYVSSESESEEDWILN